MLTSGAGVLGHKESVTEIRALSLQVGPLGIRERKEEKRRNWILIFPRLQ